MEDIWPDVHKGLKITLGSSLKMEISEVEISMAMEISKMKISKMEISAWKCAFQSCEPVMLTGS